MVDEKQAKRGRVGSPMDLEIVPIRNWLQKFVPIRLMFAHVGTQSGNRRLIVAVCLYIGLRVICRDSNYFYPEEVAKGCE